VLSFVALALSLGAFCLLEKSNGWPSQMSFAVLFGVLTSGLTILLGDRTKLGGRALGITGLATLGWLPAIFLMLAFVREPIVTTHWQCGTGLAAAMMMSVFAPVPLLLLSSWIARGAGSPRLDPWLRGVTFGALVLVALATTVGLARIHRPDADDYRASVPIVVPALAPGDSFVIGDGTRVTYREGRACTLEGIAGAAYGEMASYGGRCPTQTVRHDAKEDLWIVEGSAPRTVGDFAFKGVEKRSRNIEIADVARSISPPIAWTFGGLIGSLAGTALFVSGVWLERRRAAFATWIEGNLREDGWVVFVGRPPVRLQSMVTTGPGPVLVHMRGESPASYRETGGGTVENWRPGTIEEARAELQGRAVSRYALALTSALLCAAPLLLSGLGGSR
jgi:hypothetical protein